MAAIIYGTPELLNASIGAVTSLTLSDGPLDLQWKHSAMTADLIATMLALPYADRRTVHSQLRHSIDYLANELIENAVKFRQPGEIRIDVGITQDDFLMRVTHVVDRDSASRFQQLLGQITGRDAGELLLEQIESNAATDSDGSGLGLLTLLSDYEARMGWSFEDRGDRGVVLTTTAAVALAPYINA
jgi:hypothetical protein